MKFKVLSKIYPWLALSVLLLGSVVPSVTVLAQEEIASSHVVSSSSEAAAETSVAESSTQSEPAPATQTANEEVVAEDSEVAQETSATDPPEENKEEGHTALRGATMKGQLTMTMTNESGAAPQYTTEKAVAKMTIDGSGLKEELTGAYAEVRVPAQYVKSVEVAEGGPVTKATKGVIDGDNYVLKIPLIDITQTTFASFPINIQFKNRVVPSGYVLNPTFAIRQEDDRVIAGPNRNLSYTIKTETAPFHKFANDQLNTPEVYAGREDEANKGYLTNDVSKLGFVNYTFAYETTYGKTFTWGNRLDRTRAMEEVTLTDTLPTYTKADGTTATAHFDADANPGWTLSADGKTVTYTVNEGTNKTGNGQTDTENAVAKVNLKLKFPGAKIDSTPTNKVHTSAKLENQGENEANIENDDNRSAKLKGVLISDPAFGKGTNSGWSIGVDGGEPTTAQQVWNLNWRNTAPYPVSEMTIYDKSMDSRLYFEKVQSYDGNHTFQVIGIDAAGTETVIGTLAANGTLEVDTATKEAVNSQAAEIYNGTKTEADWQTITRKYDQIKIKLSDGESYDPNATSYFWVVARLVNPFDRAGNLSPDKYKNTAHAEGKVDLPDGTKEDFKTPDRSVQVGIAYKKESAEINKGIRWNTNGSLGEVVQYNLNLNFANLSGGRTISNGKMIDIIPQGLDYVGYYINTNVERNLFKNIYKVDNYNGTGRQAVIFELQDNLKFSTATNIARGATVIISARITDNAIPSNVQKADDYKKNEDNYVYFVADGFKPTPDGVSTTRTLPNIFGIQVDGETPTTLMGAKVATKVQMPEAVNSSKKIRVNESDSWTKNKQLIDYNSSFAYNLETRNFSVTPIKDFVLYDRLPFSGDANKSSFSNLLQSAIEADDRFEVYYHLGADMPNDPVVGVKKDGWLTVDQVTDFTKVTAVKIVMKDGSVIDAGETLNFVLNMKTPEYSDGSTDTLTSTNTFFTNRDKTNPDSFGETNAVANRLPRYIPVSKSWVGSKNLDSVVFQLYRSSNPNKTLAEVTLSEQNDWKAIFKALSDGTLLDPDTTDYDVREILKENYAKDYDASKTGSYDANDGITITNTRKTVQLTVTKTWQGDENVPADKKQQPVTVQLTKDGQAVDGETAVLNADGSWTATFTGLDKSDNGVDHEYDAVEVSNHDGYLVENGAVSKDADGNFAKTITNKFVQPTAENAESWGLQGQEQTGTVKFNPGSTTVNGETVTVPIKENSLRFVVDGVETSETTIPAKDVNGKEIGSYTLNQNGDVVFQPNPDYTGEVEPAPAIIRAEDENGTTVDAQYQPHVKGIKPKGEDVTSKDIQGAVQKNTPIFKPGDPSLPIKIDAEQPAKFVVDGKEVNDTTIDAKDAKGNIIGSYSIEPTTGEVTFTPNKDFVGTAQPAVVQAKDVNGTAARAKYTPTVVAVKPSATDVTSKDIQGATQTGKPEFTGGSVEINGETKTVEIDQDVPAKLKDKDGNLVTELTVEGEGTYSVAADGTVTFTPVPEFTGKATTVTVVRVDKNGIEAEGHYTPTVVGAKPTATGDETRDIQGAVQTGQLTFTAGSADVDGTTKTIPLKENSLKFLVDGKVVEGDTIDAKDEKGKTIGTYKLNQDGSVVFTPDKDYYGTPVPATVRAEDELGQTVDAVYQPHVTKVEPKGKDVESSGPQGAEQEGTPVFTPGHKDVPILINDEQPAQFIDPSTGKVTDKTELPAMKDGKEVGKYTLDPMTGKVTFTPNKDFVGTPDGIEVQVKDANGTPAKAKYTPTVRPTSREGVDKTTKDIQGKEQKATPEFFFDADPEGPNSKKEPIIISESNPAKLVDPKTGELVETLPATKDGKEIGTYTINPLTGEVTFTPNKDFVGTADPVTVEVKDPNGVKVTAKYTPTVTPVIPTAQDVTRTGKQGQTLTGKVEFKEGDPQVPIDETVDPVLVDKDGNPVPLNDKGEYVVPGEGTYTVDKDGNVTFVPEKNFTGTGTGVFVQRQDVNGTKVQGKFTPIITPVKITGDHKETTGKQGEEQNATPSFKDGDGNVITPSEKNPAFFLDKDNKPIKNEDGSPVTEIDALDKDGKVIGKYTLDPATGKITFKPNKDFVGDPQPAKIGVFDEFGNMGIGTYQPHVTPDPTPVPQPDPKPDKKVKPSEEKPEAKPGKQVILPRTGETISLVLIVGGVLLAVGAGFVLTKKKKENE